LQKSVAQFGPTDWNAIAIHIPGRSPRQCRDRWLSYLSPEVNRSPWTSDEDGLLFDLLMTHGPKWGSLVGFFCNRTQNNVKNRWNTILRKANALGLDPADRSSFVEAGQRIASRSTRATFEHPRLLPIPDPVQFYSLGNLLNTPIPPT
jgi:hypothetical protein